MGVVALAAAGMPLLASAGVWDRPYCVNYGYPNMGDCQSQGYGHNGGYSYTYPAYYDYYYPEPIYSYQPQYYNPTYYYPQYYPQPSYSYTNYGAPIVMVNSGYYGGYVY